MARLATGKTQASFAAEIGISQAQLSKIEDGLKTEVLVGTIEQMSERTAYPPAFFSKAGGRRSMSDDLFRKASSVGSKVLARNDALVNIKRLEIEALLPKIEFATEIRPQLDPDDFKGGAKEIARNMRHAWRINQGPIENLTKVVEDCGCVVIFFEFGTAKIDGLTVFANDGTPIIFLNPLFSASRMRATLAHELGHVLMHKFMTPTADEEAWEFAYEFLMPEYEIRPNMFPLSVDKLILLKRKWKVSMQFLLKWANEMGALKDGYYRVLMSEISKRGWRKNEPFDDEWPIEQPTFLREIVDYHLDELNYSIDDLKDVLSPNQNTFVAEYFNRLVAI